MPNLLIWNFQIISMAPLDLGIHTISCSKKKMNSQSQHRLDMKMECTKMKY